MKAKGDMEACVALEDLIERHPGFETPILVRSAGPLPTDAHVLARATEVLEANGLTVYSVELARRAVAPDERAATWVVSCAAELRKGGFGVLEDPTEELVRSWLRGIHRVIERAISFDVTSIAGELSGPAGAELTATLSWSAVQEETHHMQSMTALFGALIREAREVAGSKGPIDADPTLRLFERCVLEDHAEVPDDRLTEGGMGDAIERALAQGVEETLRMVARHGPTTARLMAIATGERQRAWWRAWYARRERVG